MNEVQKVSSPTYGDIRVLGSPKPTEFCFVDVCNALNIETKKAQKWLSKENVRIELSKDRTGRRTCPVRFLNMDGVDDIVNGSGKQEAKNLREFLITTDNIKKPSIVIELEALIEENERLKAENERLTQLFAGGFYGGLYTTTEIAKEFGYSAGILNGMLKIVGVQYYKSGIWILKAPYSRYGLTQLVTKSFKRSNGNPGSSKLTVWTEKGRLFLKILQKNGFDTNKAMKEFENPTFKSHHRLYKL